MRDFFAILLFINVICSVVYRITLQTKIPLLMSKYKDFFSMVDVDKILLIIPEFCPIDKFLSKVPEDNFELIDYFKSLKKTRFFLIPSFCLLFLYAFLFADRI